MKKVILSVFTLAAIATTGIAQTAAAPAAAPVAAAAPQDEKKTQIDVSALPDGVKQALAGDKYKEWKATTAWYVTGASEYYVVDLQKGDEKTSLKFDKSGKVIS